MVCGQSKLKALVANIALQHTKGVEAANSPTRYCICETNWYIMGLLLIMLLGITYLVMCNVRKSCFFKGHLFSNITKILLFVSNATNCVPIKLNNIAGSISLFKLKGRLTIENVRFKKELDLGHFRDRLERHEHDNKWKPYTSAYHIGYTS